jgi:hypothetical protein
MEFKSKVQADIFVELMEKIAQEPDLATTMLPITKMLKGTDSNLRKEKMAEFIKIIVAGMNKAGEEILAKHGNQD